MEKLLLKELHLFVAVLGLLCFSACGDDDSSTGSESEFLSEEDLPSCGEGREGKFAVVGDDYYVCLDKMWSKVRHFVESVCNIEICNAPLEGEAVFVEDSEQGYQCRNKKWVNSEGEGFKDQEYIDCFVAAVADSVASTKSLKKCTEAKEGSLASVGKQLMACTHQKWVNLGSVVISTSDLPACKTNGEYAFVLGKMQAYECKDGYWNSGTPIENSSSSITPVKETSSSSKAVILDDGTPVRGTCLASQKEVMKENAVTWKFVNMGGTPITYSWTFFKDETVITSEEAGPELSFARPGLYTAKLVINEGMESESDTIVCQKLRVRGNPVTDCECTTETSTLRASVVSPGSATWTVSGCKGEAPFTYQWDNGADGTEASALGTTTSGGDFAPTVTVTNSDGESMEPVCQTIPVDPIMSASCHIEIEDETHTFYAEEFRDFRKPGDDDRIELEFNLVGNGKTFSVTTTSWCEYCSVDRIAVELDGSGETLDFYELKHGDDVLCRVVDAACSPSQSNIYVGESVEWNVTGVKNYTAVSYQWTFMQEASDYWMPYDTLATMTEKTPSLLVETPRPVHASLLLNKGTDQEVSIFCQPVYVDPHPIENCACSMELVSSSNDLNEVDVVKYKWTMNDCENMASGSISYSWHGSYDDEDGKDNTFTMSMSEIGNYSVYANISNAEGYEIGVYCEEAQVTDANVTMLDIQSGQTLEGGDYYIASCNGYSYSTYWYYSSSSDIQDWLLSEYSGPWGDELYVYYPVRMSIPEGETFFVDYCY